MFKRFIVFIIIISFILSNYQPVYAQSALPKGGDFNVNELPEPGQMVNPSVPFSPLALKGLVIDLQKPLEFQFIVDTGDSLPLRGEGQVGGNQEQNLKLKQQANTLIKYFLAGLTIPEGDLWVNLSPYERNRMLPSALGQTGLGRDLLAQDYILKQLTASLIYPERDLGKDFWSRVYKEAQAQFGTTNIPVNTFNKVWILPDEAQVFENGSAAYVTKATLKVMLDEDYLSLQKHQSQPGDMTSVVSSSSLASRLIRQLILPAIEHEVNTGKNFAPLRQIYQTLILAKWYKQTIQNGLLDAIYNDKNKTAGVNLNDPTIKEQIYNRYIQAYKKGVFNYIKEDQIMSSPNQSMMSSPNAFVGDLAPTTPRKYFSGGTNMLISDFKTNGSKAMVTANGAMIALGVVLENPANINGAMLTELILVSALLATIKYAGHLKSKRKEKENEKLMASMPEHISSALNLRSNNQQVIVALSQFDAILDRLKKNKQNISLSDNHGGYLKYSIWIESTRNILTKETYSVNPKVRLAVYKILSKIDNAWELLEDCRNRETNQEAMDYLNLLLGGTARVINKPHEPSALAVKASTKSVMGYAVKIAKDYQPGNDHKRPTRFTVETTGDNGNKREYDLGEIELPLSLSPDILARDLEGKFDVLFKGFQIDENMFEGYYPDHVNVYSFLQSGYLTSDHHVKQGFTKLGQDFDDAFPGYDPIARDHVEIGLHYAQGISEIYFFSAIRDTVLDLPKGMDILPDVLCRLSTVIQGNDLDWKDLADEFRYKHIPVTGIQRIAIEQVPENSPVFARYGIVTKHELISLEQRGGGAVIYRISLPSWNDLYLVNHEREALITPLITGAITSIIRNLGFEQMNNSGDVASIFKRVGINVTVRDIQEVTGAPQTGLIIRRSGMYWPSVTRRILNQGKFFKVKLIIVNTPFDVYLESNAAMTIKNKVDDGQPLIARHWAEYLHLAQTLPDARSYADAYDGYTGSRYPSGESKRGWILKALEISDRGGKYTIRVEKQPVAETQESAWNFWFGFLSTYPTNLFSGIEYRVILEELHNTARINPAMLTFNSIFHKVGERGYLVPSAVLALLTQIAQSIAEDHEQMISPEEFYSRFRIAFEKELPAKAELQKFYNILFDPNNREELLSILNHSSGFFLMPVENLSTEEGGIRSVNSFALTEMYMAESSLAERGILGLAERLLKEQVPDIYEILKKYDGLGGEIGLWQVLLTPDNKVLSQDIRVLRNFIANVEENPDSYWEPVSHLFDQINSLHLGEIDPDIQLAAKEFSQRSSESLLKIAFDIILKRYQPLIEKSMPGLINRVCDIYAQENHTSDQVTGFRSQLMINLVQMKGMVRDLKGRKPAIETGSLGNGYFVLADAHLTGFQITKLYDLIRSSPDIPKAELIGLSAASISAALPGDDGLALETNQAKVMAQNAFMGTDGRLKRFSNEDAEKFMIGNDIAMTLGYYSYGISKDAVIVFNEEGQELIRYKSNDFRIFLIRYVHMVLKVIIGQTVEPSGKPINQKVVFPILLRVIPALLISGNAVLDRSSGDLVGAIIGDPFGTEVGLLPDEAKKNPDVLINLTARVAYALAENEFNGNHGPILKLSSMEMVLKNNLNAAMFSLGENVVTIPPEWGKGLLDKNKNSFNFPVLNEDFSYLVELRYFVNKSSKQKEYFVFLRLITVGGLNGYVVGKLYLGNYRNFAYFMFDKLNAKKLDYASFQENLIAKHMSAELKNFKPLEDPNSKEKEKIANVLAQRLGGKSGKALPKNMAFTVNVDLGYSTDSIRQLLLDVINTRIFWISDNSYIYNSNPWIDFELADRALKGKPGKYYLNEIRVNGHLKYYEVYITPQTSILFDANSAMLHKAHEISKVSSVPVQGGIDLNQIKVNKTGKKMAVHFDQAQLTSLLDDDFQGFTPVITDFRYIKSPFPLLGVNTT